MRSLYPLLALLVMIGCADTHKVTKTGGMQVGPVLERQVSAYVAVPSDGRYGATVYSGSGAMTAQIIVSALAPYLSKVTIATKTEDLDQAMATARAGNFRYLFYPQILQWEDRATEWSGKPDLATVKLSIFATDTGTLLDSAMIDGKSGLATFGGDHRSPTGFVAEANESVRHNPIQMTRLTSR